MTPLQKHRAMLYGRIGASFVAFLSGTVLAASSAIADGIGTFPYLVGGLLIGSVVVLPRRAAPRSEEVREAADDEELEFYDRVRRWLTWTRLAYLAIGIFALVGLPRLVG